MKYYISQPAEVTNRMIDEWTEAIVGFLYAQHNEYESLRQGLFGDKNTRFDRVLCLKNADIVFIINRPDALQDEVDYNKTIADTALNIGCIVISSDYENHSLTNVHAKYTDKHQKSMFMVLPGEDVYLGCFLVNDKISSEVKCDWGAFLTPQELIENVKTWYPTTQEVDMEMSFVINPGKRYLERIDLGSFIEYNTTKADDKDE